MTEVEKLYELAGVEKKLYCDICKAKEHALGLCAETKCDVFYPPFTTEKQIELIKWLANIERNGDKDMNMTIRNNSNHPYYYFGLAHNSSNSEDDNWGYGEGLGKTFEEGLVRLVIDLWQGLTEAEQNEIKEILK